MISRLLDAVNIKTNLNQNMMGISPRLAKRAEQFLVELQKITMAPQSFRSALG
jgi:hypothetical protein